MLCCWQCNNQRFYALFNEVSINGFLFANNLLETSVDGNLANLIFSALTIFPTAQTLKTDAPKVHHENSLRENVGLPV